MDVDKTGRASLSFYQSWRREGGEGGVGSVKAPGRKRSNQIAKELSDMVTYVQSWRREGGEGGVGSVKAPGRKRSNQIAKELSDMVTYVQAIKFRGLNPLSPRSSMKQPAQHKDSAGCSSFESSESSDSTGTQLAATTSNLSARARCLNQPAAAHPCYKCSSVNEAIGKKICRKHPMAVIAHTETQLVRTYPAGLRIDSSNFDPVTFWCCGVQLVALNYQTEDAAMAINAAMFESNGCVGFVRRPRVMWDPRHIAYRRFNPMDKEFDGIHAAQLTLSVISGQYVAENVYSFYNVFVEVEILGVPADCRKLRTKVTRRNALNPVWNDTFTFKVNFPELAFVRFEIYDADTNYMLSQRVIPLQCLRPGYRHVRLRSPTNQPLNMASLFIFSRCCEELAAPECCRDDAEPASPNQRRKIHFLVVYAVARHEPYSILKVTQDTTANEAIAQCLTKAGVCRTARGSYVLVEEVSSRAPTQRVLGPNERVLRAATARPGARLLLKKVGDDPSSRAWLTSIRSASNDRPKEKSVPSDSDSSCAEEPRKPPGSFLVCVHNVSHEIPYAILKVPLSATASYVVYQALTKARCHDDPKRFVLVEELEWGGRVGTGPQQRALLDDEVVYAAQASWKTLGRFVLQEKGSTAPIPRHRAAIARIQRGLSMTRGAIGTTFGVTETAVEGRPPQPLDTTYCRRPSSTPLGRGIARSKGHSDKDMRAYMQKRTASREVHSEGETGGSLGAEALAAQAFRRLGVSLANQRASLSTELGSLWDIFKTERDRRRSAPASYDPVHSDTQKSPVRWTERDRRRSAPASYDPVHSDTQKSPVRLARDLLQVVQETVFKKFDETPRKCPLVKEESGLSSDEEDGDRRIANLIDFFFTIVRSQKGERKSSGGSCFKSEVSPTEERVAPYTPVRVNIELEKKMETLIDFLASTGCIENEVKKEDKKITLMEFLFGAEASRPVIEINLPQVEISKGLSLSESNINVIGLSYIDETPVEDEAIVDLFMHYMEYSPSDTRKDSKAMSITPSLSEKSKSDVTISKLDNFSEFSKTKSDSTLTQTQDTVIDRFEVRSDRSRRISETVVDLSFVKQDLEEIFDLAVDKVSEVSNIISADDTMSDQEDIENFNSYTKPESTQHLPYSVELSDIMEEDEFSSNDFEKMTDKEKYEYAKRLAEDLIQYIEDNIQPCETDSDSEDEFDFEIKRSSISLIDLRNIPDLPPSMIIKPKVIKVDKATSTTDISGSNSDLSKRIDSCCNTEETSISNSSEQRALDKLESLTKFFCKKRLGIIDESHEDAAKKIFLDSEIEKSSQEFKAGQASLDDVDDIQDETFVADKNYNDLTIDTQVDNKMTRNEIDDNPSVTNLPSEWIVDDD
ncbi:hypothetical protein O0L34_g6560 [Tuta absoluta]|nr:hypothetical protein O0L34_g6560 [Tuta absoluta]